MADWYTMDPYENLQAFKVAQKVVRQATECILSLADNRALEDLLSRIEDGLEQAIYDHTDLGEPGADPDDCVQ